MRAGHRRYALTYAVLPDAGIFWRIVERYKVDGLFTAPTALRAVRKEDPDAKLMRKYNLRSLRNLFLAGERSEPGIISCYLSLLSELGAPGASVRDNAWSTGTLRLGCSAEGAESGSPITSTALSSAYAPVPPRPGSAGLPLPGWDVRVVDDGASLSRDGVDCDGVPQPLLLESHPACQLTQPIDGKMVPLGQLGNIVLAPPLAPSALTTLWRNEPRHQEAYYDQVRCGTALRALTEQFRGKGDYFATGDAGIIDEQGYVHILSRTDDVINCAGHRLSTSLIEQVVSSHPLIAECCVVGRPDELKVRQSGFRRADHAGPRPFRLRHARRVARGAECGRRDPPPRDQRPRPPRHWRHRHRLWPRQGPATQDGTSQVLLVVLMRRSAPARRYVARFAR